MQYFYTCLLWIAPHPRAGADDARGSHVVVADERGGEGARGAVLRVGSQLPRERPLLPQRRSHLQEEARPQKVCPQPVIKKIILGCVGEFIFQKKLDLKKCAPTEIFLGCLKSPP